MRSLIKSIELTPTLADCHLRLIELSIKNGMDLKDVEQLYEGALSVCGLHPAEGPVIWSEYRRFLSQTDEENVQQRVSKVRDLFYRQMSLPLSGLPDLLDEYRIWEEELSDENRESFEVAREHYSRGQQEWSLRKPLEMRVQTDNVSNLQELFDAWMAYINFEKDRMLSIDYSSDAVPLKESRSGCSRSGLPAKYKFDTKDSVIMAYRRALDDLGSIRIDLWLEFANFISTTTNCPHLLSSVYASSLQHFSANPKLWILYLLATAEAIKDIASHFCQFQHFYRPGCKVRSSAAWYPQNDQILKVTNLKEMLEVVLDNYLSELAHSQEIFSESKQDSLELYFVATNSLIDINKSLKVHLDAAKMTIHPETDVQSGGESAVRHALELEELIFGKLERLYSQGEELLLGGNVRLVDGETRGGEFHVLEESVVLFYSQWLDFELLRSKNIKEVAVSMLEKFLNKEEQMQEQTGTAFLSLIISVIKTRLTTQEQTELWQSVKLILDLYPEEVRAWVSAEWESAGDSAIYTDGSKRQRLDLAEGELGILYSPTIRHIPLGVSSSSEGGGKLSQEISQCVVLPVPILQQVPITGTAVIGTCGLSSKSKANDEGDFVCLSEIRLRRDKRRSRRNFNESDYDTSSECSSSESNSFSALVGSSGSGANGGRQLFRNFTPPGTPTSYALQKVPATALAQSHSHNLKSSPCSPNIASTGGAVQQQAVVLLPHLDQSGSNSNSFTPRGGSMIKSPVLVPQDLEARTQCTWDGREATEPSIAPPIPPIPSLASISSVSSTSSHSSLGSRQFERPGPQLTSGGGEQQQQVFGFERAVDDQNMPPPPYTPKKSRVERCSGGSSLARQLSASSAAMAASASEDSDLSSSLRDNSRTNGSNSSPDPENGTLFIRFPQNQEMDEEKLKMVFLDHFPVNIIQVRVVRDVKGSQKGFAYMDVEPGVVDEVVGNSEGLRRLGGIGIQVSASNPPQRSRVPKRSHSRSKRLARRKQLQDRQDAAASSTILIKNIDKSLGEEQVVSHFQDGLGLKVKNISISRDQNGASRGFAFMEFFSSEEALTAHMLNESRLGSTNITVSSSTRPLTFPRLVDSLSARFAPRTKSKQKLPPGGRPVSTSNKGDPEESKPHSVCEDLESDIIGGGESVGTGCSGGVSSLTNEDFRRLFL